MRARLANIGLALRCAWHWMLHGSARRVPPRPRSIVIVQFGKLGDMVCTTPLFRAIKAHDPSIRVIVVGDRTGGEVLAGSADVDRYLVCGVDIARTLEVLRLERPDVGITAGPSLRGFALLYLASIPAVAAPRVVGGRSSESRIYKIVRALGIVMPHRMGHYAPREYLRLLEPFGILSEDTTKHLAVAPEASAAISKFWAQHNLEGSFVAGVSPSAGNRIKQWPAERFAAVVDHMYRNGTKVILIAGPHDQVEVKAVCGALAPDTAVITANTFSIEELKACIEQLDLFVSVDTGPIYIAEALGTPTVDIVGPVDEREQPPIGPRHAVVVPARSRPELYVMNPYQYDKAEVFRQIKSITAQQVIEVVDELAQRMRRRMP